MPRIACATTEGTIANAFDVAFAGHGLLTQQHRQLQLAMISMLQGVRFADNKGKGKGFGTLVVVIYRERIELRGVVTLRSGGRAQFPVLTVANDCFPMHSQYGKVMAKSMLKVVVRDGVTILEGVKPYEIHVGRRRERGREEPAPIEWVEVESALTDVPVQSFNSNEAEFSILGLDGLPVAFKLRDGRISFAGASEYFAADSPIWKCALHRKGHLAARVYDDLGGYLFETVETLNQLEPV